MSNLENPVPAGTVNAEEFWQDTDNYLDGIAACGNINKNIDMIYGSGDRMIWGAMIALAWHGT